MATCKYGCIIVAVRAMDPDSVRELADSIDSAATFLRAQMQALQFQIQLVDLRLAPLREAYSQLMDRVNQERSKLNVVPAEHVMLCPELGILQQYLQQVLDMLLAQVDALFRKIENLLNLSLQLAFALEMFRQLIQFLEDVMNCVQSALEA